MKKLYLIYVLLGFTEFYQTWLVFFEFHWVLSTSNGFY